MFGFQSSSVYGPLKKEKNRNEADKSSGLDGKKLGDPHQR